METMVLAAVDSITTLAWAADGDSIWVGTYTQGDTPSWLLRIDPAGEVLDRQEFGGSVRVIRRSPDGERIAYGIARAAAEYRIRHVATGAEVAFEVASKGWTLDARAFDWLPDGRLVAARGRLVACFDPDDESLRAFESKHTYPVMSVACTPDGRWAVTTDQTKQLRVWNIDTGRQVRRLMGREFGVAGCAPTGDVVIQTGAWGIAIFEVGGKWPEIAQLMTPALATTSPAFLPGTPNAVLGSGASLMVVDGDHSMRVAAAIPKGELRTVAVAPNGSRVAAGGTSGQLFLWNVEELQ